MTLNVSLSIVIKDNKILLFERKRGDFEGYLSIPGGKVEDNENISDTAERELFEESGIKADFLKYLGCVSEFLIEDKKVLSKLILHICKLDPKTNILKASDEGSAKWCDIYSLENLKEKIIPSGYEIIKRCMENEYIGYFNCVEEKIGDKYYLREFISERDFECKSRNRNT